MKNKTSKKTAPKKSAAKKAIKTANKAPKKTPAKKSTVAKGAAKKAPKQTSAKKPVVKKTVPKKQMAKVAPKKQAKPCAKQSAPKANKDVKQSGGKKVAASTTKPSQKTTGKRPSASKNPVTTPAIAKQDGLVTVEIKIHSDAKGGHPHVMLGQLQEKNVSVGITHDKYKGKMHKNIPLQHNPLGTGEQVYMRRQGTVDKQSNYHSESKQGKLTQSDNAKAKQIGEKAKRKELNKKTPKK